MMQHDADAWPGGRCPGTRQKRHRPHQVAGRTVTSVAAHGKHLVIELDNGASLRAHLGMNGRFRAYDRAAGEAMLAKLSPGRASLALVTDDGVYLWIGAPTIEISRRRDPRHGMAVSALGPDILADDFDSRGAASRAAEHGSRLIAEVLLDQRVVAGIGNIYKCEALFTAGIDPRARVGQLDAATLDRIYAAARRLMIANLGPAPRGASPSRPPPRTANFLVYSRTGKPCTRCGTPIPVTRSANPHDGRGRARRANPMPRIAAPCSRRAFRDAGSVIRALGVIVARHANLEDVHR